MEQIENSAGETKQESFNRPPRIWTPLPQGTFTLPAPPGEEMEPPRPGMLMLLLPVLAMATLIGVSIAFSHGSLQQLAFIMPMAIFALINPLTMMIDARQKRKAVQRRLVANSKQYMEATAELREQLLQQTNEQRRIALLTDPDPESLEERVRQRFHLWERR